MMEKPNCFECEYRGKVPGSRHSSCQHPSFKEANDDPLLNVMAILGSVGRVPQINVESKKCKVVGSSHGIKNGWFNHPFNFDPNWLESCNGFKTKKDVKTTEKV